MSETSVERSRQLHERARRTAPGGVHGEGQFYPPNPLYFETGSGKWLTDIDGNRYLDYHGGFGTAILGYQNAEVTDAVAQATLERGTFLGLPHEGGVDLSERLCALIPSAEVVALSGGGGSDSLYVATRLARSLTGRKKLLKIEGGYHGWHSDLAVGVRPPLDALPEVGLPVAVSGGSLPEVTDQVVVVEANDTAALHDAFERHGSELALAVVEPILFSAGCFRIQPDFMAALREGCDTSGALLLFDEVMSGFRSGLAGAGSQSGVMPDLSVFGKAMANGYIISALTGRRAVMDHLSPVGPAFFSGTFNGHPLSVAAALKTLEIIERDNVADRLSELTERMVSGVNAEISRLGVNAVCQGTGSVWSLYFLTRSVRRYRDIGGDNPVLANQLTREFFQHLRESGIYAQQRMFVRCFLSAEHREEDIDRTIDVVADFLNSKRAVLTD